MDIVQVYSDHGRSGLNIAGSEGLMGSGKFEPEQMLVFGKL